jgi:MYXO-CTERM domain-containing protein
MRPALVAAGLIVALAAPASALAAAGPVPPLQGGAGVGLPEGPVRYVAVAAGHDTLVERVRAHGGAVERTRLLPGAFGVAAVAFDGSTTGLSADGRTLVLASTTRVYPPRTTRLAVLDTRRLRPQAPVALRGFYAVDAISPDGRWVYLIHYPSPTNLLRYEVRAYDRLARRMLARPVIDPHEPDEAMAGMPVTRVSSADGRWAYTLYQRPAGKPFIHALDTAGRTARCIDLPTLGGGDLSSASLRLEEGGASLVVESGAGPQARIDTTRFTVRAPSTAPPAARRAIAPDPGGDSPWVLALLPLSALVALVLGRRRRALGS